MFTIYDDETAPMAIKRYEVLLADEIKELNRPPKTSVLLPCERIMRLAQEALLKEIAPGFVESESRKLVCRRDGKLEHAQLDDEGVLSYFVDDKLAWHLRMVRGSRFHAVKGEVCVHPERKSGYDVMRISSTLFVRTTDCVKSSKITRAVDHDDAGNNAKRLEAAAALAIEEKRKAKRVAVELERRTTIDRYQLAIEYLRLREESQLPLRPLKTVPRPVSDRRRALLSCTVNETKRDPSIPNYTVRLFPGLLVVTSTTKSVAVKDPQAWTINNDWLSVLTDAGWVGFSLLTGEPAEPIPFQYNCKFELMDVSEPFW